MQYGWKASVRDDTIGYGNITENSLRKNDTFE